jgi:DNA-binding transcriptional LysR family regulator
MDLRQLRNMLAVIETGSLSEAAEKLRISQPALTKSIQRLESALGVKLFTREARGMRATVFAESLREYAQSACVGMTQLLIEINAIKSGATGVVTVAGPPIIALDLFPEAIIRLSKDRPNVQIRVVVEVDSLYTSLLAGKFDLVVATLSHEIPKFGLETQALFEDRLVVVTRAGHPLTRRRKVGLQDLLASSWIFPDEGSLHRSRLEMLFQAAGLPLPQPVIECRSPELVKAAIINTDYIGLLAKMGLRAELDARTLCAIEIESPFLLRTIGLIWRNNHSLSPPTKALISMFQTICSERKYAKPA